MFFTGKLERALKSILEVRLPALEARVQLLEQEIVGHLRSLNTVLNGMTDVNLRLTKEKTDPKVVAAEMKKTSAYQALVDRITELDDEVSTWSTSMTQHNRRQNRLETRVAQLEGMFKTLVVQDSPSLDLSLDETRVMDEAYLQKHREKDGE
jgi:predicted nuclease with TOPRIM domain